MIVLYDSTPDERGSRYFWLPPVVSLPSWVCGADGYGFLFTPAHVPNRYFEALGEPLYMVKGRDFDVDDLDDLARISGHLVDIRPCKTMLDWVACAPERAEHLQREEERRREEYERAVQYRAAKAAWDREQAELDATARNRQVSRDQLNEVCVQCQCARRAPHSCVSSGNGQDSKP